MIDISLEHQGGTVIAFVSNSETGSTTSVGGNTETQAIQSALNWANLFVKIRGSVTTTGVMVSKTELESLKADSQDLKSIQAAETEGFGTL